MDGRADRAARAARRDPRRPGLGDDVEERRPAADRPRRRPQPLAPAGVQRQPVQRVPVQNAEVPQRFSRTVRLDRARPHLVQGLLRLPAARAPPFRARPAHTGVGVLRHRRRHPGRTSAGHGRRLRRQPEPVRHPTAAPETADRGMDQPTDPTTENSVHIMRRCLKRLDSYRTAPHHGGARSPARHPLSPPGEGDVEHVYLGAEAIEGAPMTTQQVRVDGVDIAYTDTDTGSGPTILFVHGVYVTGALRNDVVSELGGGFRCVVPTWPLGAHSTPTGGADLGAEATARRIVHFIEALDLRDVTVVANDTGGGLVLTALGDATLDKSRIGRLVLTNCDSYEHFPPGSFAHIVKLCRLSSTVGVASTRVVYEPGLMCWGGVS